MRGVTVNHDMSNLIGSRNSRLAKHTPGYVWAGRAGVTLGTIPGPRPLYSPALFSYSASRLLQIKHLCSTTHFHHEASALEPLKPELN